MEWNPRSYYLWWVSAVTLLGLLQPTECRIRHEDPIFKPTKQNVTVSPGDRAVLKCQVEHLGTKTIAWRRDGQPHPLTIGLFVYVSDTRMSVDYKQRTNEWSLIIQDVKPSDEGKYFCQISTKKSGSKKAYEVFLFVKTVMVSGPQYVVIADPIHLKCNATGKPYPPSTIEWFKDGDRVESDPEKGIRITKKIQSNVLISEIVIKKSTRQDDGDYLCMSSDGQVAHREVHIINMTNQNKKRSHEGSGSPGVISDNSGGSSLHWPSLCTLLTVTATMWTVYVFQGFQV